MRVLVITVVHHPGDARIAHRQIPALLTAGHSVTYAAPFAAYAVAAPADVRPFNLPRAQGRSRLAAVRAARTLLRREAPSYDIVVLHDPELLLAVPRSLRTPVVWDVHEDTAAAVSLKPWLPSPLRPMTAALVSGVESRASRRVHLILAEDGYRSRFRGEHPVVPNSTPSPPEVAPSGGHRVVYVGSLTRARGVHEMVELGGRLRGSGIEVHLVGQADTEATEALRAAQSSGSVVWHGFLPNTEALELLDGALAGLSLLHDEPNYRHSMPTKVIEYMAHGVPVITTPTPPARALVERAACGVVVPFDDVPAAAQAAVHHLSEDPLVRQAMADSGRLVALAEFDWRTDGPRFVAILEHWAGAGR